MILCWWVPIVVSCWAGGASARRLEHLTVQIAGSTDHAGHLLTIRLAWLCPVCSGAAQGVLAVRLGSTSQLVRPAFVVGSLRQEGTRCKSGTPRSGEWERQP